MTKSRFRVLSYLLCLCFGTVFGSAWADAEGNGLRIYLARHGETDWNVHKRLQGWTDINLNHNGEEQAKALGKVIRDLEIVHIYCSTLTRSHRTAEIVSSGKIPITKIPELREQSFGKFQGQYLDGRDPAVVEEYERRSADPKDSLDGGESLEQFYARVKTGLDKILNTNIQGAILIVGHGGTNTQILRALLDLSAEQSQLIEQANYELYLIEVIDKKGKRLWKFVTAEHLEEL